MTISAEQSHLLFIAVAADSSLRFDCNIPVESLVKVFSNHVAAWGSI